jgi:hypothetical protein
MTTKELLKDEVEKLPNELLEEVHRFISRIKTNPPKKARLHTFKLRGSYDKLNIRANAYE